MAESEVGILTSQCQSRRIPDKQIVEREVAAWQNHRNKHHHKNDTRAKLKRLILALRVDQKFRAIPPLDARLTDKLPKFSLASRDRAAL
jgi:hypothetical protein